MTTTSPARDGRRISVFARDPGTRACPRGDGPSCRRRKARASAPACTCGKPDDDLRADVTSDLEASSSRRRCRLESSALVARGGWASAPSAASPRRQASRRPRDGARPNRGVEVWRPATRIVPRYLLRLLTLPIAFACRRNKKSSVVHTSTRAARDAGVHGVETVDRMSRVLDQRVSGVGRETGHHSALRGSAAPAASQNHLGRSADARGRR